MKKLILVLILLLIPALAGADISSAQYNDGGSIEVTLDDGRVLHVPDDMTNRHRRKVADWETSGHTIALGDPLPELTAEEQMRMDASYPKTWEFLEGFLACRYESNCQAMDDLNRRWQTLKSNNP